jgi:uncharacterized protein (TIGR03437 family)
MSTANVPSESIEDASQYNNASGVQIGAGGVLNNPGTWSSAISPLPSLVVSPSSVSATVQVGAASSPTQVISVSSSSGGSIPFTVSYTSEGTWLTGSGGGNTPNNLTVFMSDLHMTAGTYTGTVIITSTGAANSPITVPVTLTIMPASVTSASLVVSPTSLTFSTQCPTVCGSGETDTFAELMAYSSGGPLTVTVSYASQTNWLGYTTFQTFETVPFNCTTPCTVPPVFLDTVSLTPGSYTGKVIFTSTGAANSPVSVPVTLNVTPLPTLTISPASLSFSSVVGTSSLLTQPLNISSSQTSSSPFVSVTSGSGWLSILNLPCNFANLQCSLSVEVNPSGLAAEVYSGSIAVIDTAASNSPINVPVTLTLSALPPAPIITAVVNAASFVVTSSNQVVSLLAPGSLAQIYSTLPGATTASASALPFPALLGGVSVTFNGIPAPISAVIPTGQYPIVNVQVPFELTGTTAGVVVTANNSVSSAFSVPIVPAAPGIFATTANGQGQAILVNLQNYQVANSSNPIPRGSTAYFYATGMGSLSPAVADGAANLASSSVAVPIVLIGGITAQVVYAGQAPGYPGVNQINVIIPDGAPTGPAISLEIQIVENGTVVASNVATIAIQ